MKGRIMIAAAAALALAGCGSKDGGADGAPKSSEEVKQEATKLEQPEPGEYRQIVEITRFEVPGMPKEAADRMKAMMAAKQESTTCLTKEQAEKGYRDMFKDVGKGNECTYSKFAVDGGRLDAQMDCSLPQQGQQQGKSTMKLNGTVRRDGADITMDMDVTGAPTAPGQPGRMKMTMHLTSTRLGECKSS